MHGSVIAPSGAGHTGDMFIPLAFSVASIFLLVIVAAALVAAVVFFTGAGESLRQQRLETDDDRDLDAGPDPDDRNGARPLHTSVSDPTAATAPPGPGAERAPRADAGNR